MWKETAERPDVKVVNAVGTSEGQHSADAATRKRKCVELRKKEQKKNVCAIYNKNGCSSHLFPACMRSNPSLICSKGSVWVTNSSTFSFLFM